MPEWATRPVALQPGGSEPGEVQPGWQVAACYTRSMAEDCAGTRLNTPVSQNQAKLYIRDRIPGGAPGLTVGGGR